jgi:hypothetical protein
MEEQQQCQGYTKASGFTERCTRNVKTVWGIDSMEGKDDCFCYQHKDQTQANPTATNQPYTPSVGFLPDAYTREAVRYNMANETYDSILEKFQDSEDSFQRETIVQDLVLAANNNETKQQRAFSTWAAKLLPLFTNEELRDFIMNMLPYKEAGKALLAAATAQQIGDEMLDIFDKKQAKTVGFLERFFGQGVAQQ